jgi:hypothetical protein
MTASLKLWLIHWGNFSVVFTLKPRMQWDPLGYREATLNSHRCVWLWPHPDLGMPTAHQHLNSSEKCTILFTFIWHMDYVTWAQNLLPQHTINTLYRGVWNKTSLENTESMCWSMLSLVRSCSIYIVKTEKLTDPAGWQWHRTLLTEW